MWSIVGAAFIRLFIAIAPWLQYDWNASGLRGAALREAKEIAGVISARLLLISWAPLAFLSVMARADQLSYTVSPSRATLLVAAFIGLCLSVFLLRTHWLRGLGASMTAMVVVTVLDIAFQLWLLDSVIAFLK